MNITKWYTVRKLFLLILTGESFLEFNLPWYLGKPCYVDISSKVLYISWLFSVWHHVLIQPSQCCYVRQVSSQVSTYIQGSHGSLKPLKSLEFILAPWTLEIAWNFVKTLNPLEICERQKTDKTSFSLSKYLYCSVINCFLGKLLIPP